MNKTLIIILSLIVLAFLSFFFRVYAPRGTETEGNGYILAFPMYTDTKYPELKLDASFSIKTLPDTAFTNKFEYLLTGMRYPIPDSIYSKIKPISDPVLSQILNPPVLFPNFSKDCILTAENPGRICESEPSESGTAASGAWSVELVGTPEKKQPRSE